jgi:hypothetical protein
MLSNSDVAPALALIAGLYQSSLSISLLFMLQVPIMGLMDFHIVHYRMMTQPSIAKKTLEIGSTSSMVSCTKSTQSSHKSPLPLSFLCLPSLQVSAKGRLPPMVKFLDLRMQRKMMRSYFVFVHG